jgi:hypothetical protein
MPTTTIQEPVRLLNAQIDMSYLFVSDSQDVAPVLEHLLIPDGVQIRSLFIKGSEVWGMESEIPYLWLMVHRLEFKPEYKGEYEGLADHANMPQSHLPPEIKRKFLETFGTSVDPYWDRIFGFDIIKFDDEVLAKYPESNQDGYSSRDVIVKHHGEDAAVFIETLIDLDPLKPIVEFLTA